MIIIAKTLTLSRPVIAITGSAGKTTTKEMITSILRTRWNIFKGHINTPIYTRKYAKQINSSHRALVMEYAMSNRGMIKRHCLSIQPNIGIITNVGTAHIGHFKRVRGIALAKSELIHYMNPIGTFLKNADDINSRLLETGGFKGQIISVGIKNNAHYRANDVAYARNGMDFKVILHGKQHQFFIPIYGTHNVYNALFAIAVADRLGFTIAEMKRGLQSYIKAKRRLIVSRFRNGIQMINDTYSANPNAMVAAINVLGQIGKGKRIAVLGTMKEMGKHSVPAHRSVGKSITSHNVHTLYTYGANANYIIEGAIQSGFKRTNTKHFKHRNRLNHAIIRSLRPNSTILVKGSHSMMMNKTTRFLTSYFKK